MKFRFAHLCAAALALTGASAKADLTLISEGFNNVATLAAAGWVRTNQSSPVGSTGWQQGNAGTFDAHSGAPNAFITANFNNSTPGGRINTWLITPTFTNTANGVLSFFTRTDELLGIFGDSLEVRYNAKGTTTLADFTTVLSINGDQAVDGFPADWTQFTTSWAGTGAATLGRFAFVYRVDNADNANLIGLDTVTAAVPEPASVALVGLALGGLAFARRRKA